MIQQFVTNGLVICHLDQVPKVKGIPKTMLLALYMAKCADL